jgi:hypothetical protein
MKYQATLLGQLSKPGSRGDDELIRSFHLPWDGR